jgi:hypothetical protein
MIEFAETLPGKKHSGKEQKIGDCYERLIEKITEGEAVSRELGGFVVTLSVLCLSNNVQLHENLWLRTIPGFRTLLLLLYYVFPPNSH